VLGLAPRGGAAASSRNRGRQTVPAGPACDIVDLSAVTRHLITVGKALHGRYWRRPTARNICVDIETIWRWLKGQGRPSYEDRRQLVDVARQRSSRINAVVEEAIAHLRSYVPKKSAAGSVGRDVRRNVPRKPADAFSRASPCTTHLPNAVRSTTVCIRMSVATYSRFSSSALIWRINLDQGCS
jgi:hypothetical protein